MAGQLLLSMVIKNSEWFDTRGVCPSAKYYNRRRERDWVLGEFKAGRSPILIATDVASRGLGTVFISFFSSVNLLNRQGG
jgi:hypothetical protein